MPAMRTPSETAAALDDVRRALANVTDFLIKAESELGQKKARHKALSTLVERQTEHLDALCKDPDVVVSLPEYRNMKLAAIGHRATVQKLAPEILKLEAKVQASKKTQDTLKKEEASLQGSQESRGKLLPFRARHG